MRLIDADELITAFPCGESVRTEGVRATIRHMPTIEPMDLRLGKRDIAIRVEELLDDDSYDVAVYKRESRAYCPKCDKPFGSNPYPRPNYCSECGQALSWDNYKKSHTEYFTYDDDGNECLR